MSSALEAIDAALDAVARQAQALRRSKTRQVKTLDERDALKALAYSWLKSFRGDVLTFLEEGELSVVDQTFRDMLAATARYSSRSTYWTLLKAAKADLVVLRSEATIRPARQSGNPVLVAPLPVFAALAPDARMQAILVRRWEEIERCMRADASLAATVMMGGLLESLLLARINRLKDKKPAFTAKAAPKDKSTHAPLPLTSWTLANYIDVCHELRWITKSARDVGSVLREFRNYIHPNKELSDEVPVGPSDAEMFWAVTKSMTKQVLESMQGSQ